MSDRVSVTIALIALLYSIYQSSAVRREAILERRLQFELALLAELSRQWATTRTFGHLVGHLRALVTPTFNELHVTRAATGVAATEAGEERLRALRASAQDVPDDSSLMDAQRAAVEDAITLEIAEAIDKRIDG